MQNDALESAIRELRLTGDEQWTQLLGSIMDEQPHLMAFLMNLADDFTEDVHDQLMRCTVLLSSAFKKAGIEIQTITPAGLDSILEKKIEAYEDLADEDDLIEEEMEKVANSPLVFERVRQWFMQELGEAMPILDESQANISLLVDVIISSMEEFAGEEGTTETSKEPTDA